ncbi:MAG: RNA polymerase subunit sigma [Mobilitalea sp.]
MREFDNMAIEAKSNPLLLDQFIQKNELFIIKCASSVSHSYVSKSDDEWSIALLGFTQAVEGYQLEKGNFYRFAELLIRHKLIDYHRSQAKYSPEVSVNPIVFDAEQDAEDENNSILIAVSEKISKEDNNSVTLEIEAINETIKSYGFTFFDLVDCSPKAAKTKLACAHAVTYILQNPILIQELQKTHMLPIKIIEKSVKIPRKILERHRKYIIAAVEILDGEYPHLADYLRYIREEIGK